MSQTATLPRVDVHSVVVPASRATVWSALEEYVAQSSPAGTASRATG